MTRLVRFSNNAVSQLAANLLVGGTSLSITPGDGAKFPSLSAGQYFMATLVKSDGSTEVVKVTARSTDTFTIVRAAEPVAGASTAYAFSAGDRIEARLTAGVLGNEIDRLDASAIIGAINKDTNYTVLEADVTSLIRVDTSGGTRTITLPQISSLVADFDIIIDKVTSDANAVTIARQGSDTINGGTLYTLTAQYQSAWVVADRATNTWSVIQSNSNGVGVNAIVDEGTGSGASTITLSVDPGSINNVDVVIGGVPQLTSSMSLSGTTLTVGGAIAAGVKWMAKYCVPLSIGTPADGSVTTIKLGNGAVTTDKLEDGALAATTAGLAKMANGFLQATTEGLAKMADGFLAATTAGRAKMADLFVTTAKLNDAAVTTVKIADANVTTAKIADANVTTAKIADLNVTPEKLSQKLTQGAVVASTSGTAINFASIPSWAKRITVMFSGVSTSGTTGYVVQLGTSGGIETSGYVGSSNIPNIASTNWSTYCSAVTSTQASDIWSGHVVLALVSGSTWACSVNMANQAARLCAGAGNKTTAGTLDRIRITTVNGTDTFDAGSINILYEG